MAILTDQDMIDTMGGDIHALLNVPTSTDISGNPQLQTAVTQACALVTSYLRRRYLIPLVLGGDEIIDPAVKGVAADIAAYFLAQRTRPEVLEDGSPIDLGYEKAIAWLKDVKKGGADIDQDVVTEGANYTYSGSRTVVLRADRRELRSEAAEKAQRAWQKNF